MTQRRQQGHCKLTIAVVPIEKWFRFARGLSEHDTAHNVTDQIALGDVGRKQRWRVHGGQPCADAA